MKSIKLQLLLLAVTLLAVACVPKSNNQNQLDGVDIFEPVPSLNLQPDVIYITKSELMILESFPVQIMVTVTGNMPTACHYFNTDLQPANAQNEIHIEVISQYDLNSTCIQGLQPFAENISIPMTDAEDGTYSIWINGEWVGEFSYPG